MNIKGLQYFLAVCDAGSFSRAANVALVSQSALSRQIGLLEEELGAALFDRHPRGVQLTEVGTLLRDKVHGLLLQIDQIRQEIQYEAQEPSGELGIAFPPSLTSFVVGRILPNFSTTFPRVQVRLYEGMTVSVREQLVAGNADVGILSTMDFPNDLYCSPLFTEPLMLVGPKTSGLSFESSVPVARLTDLPQIATSRTNSLRRIVERALTRNDLTYLPVVEVNTRGLLFALVEDGYGYTVLPASGVQDRFVQNRVRAAPIDDLSITWQLTTLRTRPLTLAARRAMIVLREECAAAVRQGELLFAKVDV